MTARFDGGDVPLPPYWGGFRVRPDTIEFWQGRENRLHDRILYRREGGAWRVERLSPVEQAGVARGEAVIVAEAGPPSYSSGVPLGAVSVNNGIRVHRLLVVIFLLAAFPVLRSRLRICGTGSHSSSSSARVAKHCSWAAPATRTIRTRFASTAPISSRRPLPATRPSSRSSPTPSAAAPADVPVSAASGGSTFRFQGGVPVRTSTSAGPIFAERAQTLGHGRVLAGITRTGAQVPHLSRGGSRQCAVHVHPREHQLRRLRCALRGRLRCLRRSLVRERDHRP